MGIEAVLDEAGWKCTGSSRRRPDGKSLEHYWDSCDFPNQNITVRDGGWEHVKPNDKGTWVVVGKGKDGESLSRYLKENLPRPKASLEYACKLLVRIAEELGVSTGE